MSTKIVGLADKFVNRKYALITEPPMTEALIEKMHDLILHPPMEMGISRMPRLESCGLEVVGGLLCFGVEPDERLIKYIQGLIDLAEKKLADIDTMTKQVEAHKTANTRAKLDNAAEVVKRALGQT